MRWIGTWRKRGISDEYKMVYIYILILNSKYAEKKTF